MSDAMDYGTYRARRIALLSRIKRAGADYERTRMQTYHNDLNTARIELALLDNAHPACLREFLAAAERKRIATEGWRAAQEVAK